jgi:hypothetical protein
MSKPPLTRIQDMLGAISHLTPHVFYPFDDLSMLLAAVDVDYDPALGARLLEAAVIRGVLGKAGGKYLLRRVPDPYDFVAVAREEGLTVEEPRGDLPVDELSRSILQIPNMERRLTQLQADVEALRTTQVLPGHWLSLDEDLMPRTTRDSLRDKALQSLHGTPTREDVHRQMVTIAAATLNHALKGNL